MTVMTPQLFADYELQAIGAPVTPGTEGAFIAIEQAEGGNWNNSANANPVNTTLPYDGSASMNSAGVQSYKSWTDGIAATAQTLLGTKIGGVDPYAAQVAAFRANDPVAALQDWVNSPWGTHHINYDGMTFAAGAPAPAAGSATPPGATLGQGQPPGGTTASATNVGWLPNPGNIMTDAKTFLITAGFAAAGVVLMVLGVKDFAGPTGNAASKALEVAAI